MQALQHGSLFSDVLQENWKHQLNSYRIVSFYEGVGNIVPRESAVLGIPGNIESTIRLDADHSNMCRYDPLVQKDADNFLLVRAEVEDFYDFAALQQGEAL
ncbi:MAG: hypothetical protein M1833_000164 [Piccolia ochrophora]|nr:MAG: hypothetical protein M1833_000164 [Piccolia ochrophora]